MKFVYLARDKASQMKSGTVEASSQGAALAALQDNGLVVVEIKLATRVSLLAKKLVLFKTVKKKDLVIIMRQLATLMQAKVPIVESLKTLAGQTKAPYLKEVLHNLAKDVDAGTSLSKAFNRYPKVFSPLFVSLVKSGEVSGRLQDAMLYLADHLEAEHELVSRVKGAMAYPAFVTAAFIGVGVLVMIYVVPNLLSILQEVGQELPLSTKILIAISNALVTGGWLILLAVAAAAYGLLRFLKTRTGRQIFDQIKIKTPIIGNIFKKLYLARFSENLSTLISGGLSIIKSLQVSSQVVGNSVYERIIQEAANNVKVGNTLSSSFAKHKEIPPMMTEMLKTGERSGKIEMVLKSLASFYQKEVNTTVDSMASLIEPLLIIVLGVAAAFMVASVLLPIYNIAGGL